MAPLDRVIDLPGGTEIIPTEDCWTLLGQETVGRVAVFLNEKFDIFPVNYRVVERAILFTTNLGRKLLGMMAQVVAFEVDGADERTRTGWSVVVHATADIVALDDTTSDFFDLTWAGHKGYGVRLTPTSITGRRVLAHPAA